ncbi:F-box protein At5g03100-like [Nicotiana tomentosiformis]|uniref:F-box protein At5g03100-like n=1 Tax=Nicotiana tabacum TaxID=4097 RepID=A0A1S4DM31_TOBAC|nr:F-box protein At5g03100-like [Nicotiana tomentosiformis]XP_016514462.1 PREDICTED: F-box protein At5g03100-like [Nicotiana tabacum]
MTISFPWFPSIESFIIGGIARKSDHLGSGALGTRIDLLKILIYGYILQLNLLMLKFLHLEFSIQITKDIEFPQFSYTNTKLRNLALWYCQLNPTGSVNWSSLVSLSFGYLKLTDDVMEKVLAGCPNLECLDLNGVKGIHRLEISSVKLRELIIQDYGNDNHDLWLEILAPYIQKLDLLGYCSEIRIRQRNVDSLVTAVLLLNFAFDNVEGNLEKECRYLKELLQSVAHVENLELGPWCIEFLSVLELKGWQPPPSSWKFLELPALQQLDFPGLSAFSRVHWILRHWSLIGGAMMKKEFIAPRRFCNSLFDIHDK